MQSSTVARDVFYYRNLDLGKTLVATLKRFDRVGENVILDTLLTSEADEDRLRRTRHHAGCSWDPPRCLPADCLGVSNSARASSQTATKRRRSSPARSLGNCGHPSWAKKA